MAFSGSKINKVGVCPTADNERGRSGVGVGMYTSLSMHPQPTGKIDNMNGPMRQEVYYCRMQYNSEVGKAVKKAYTAKEPCRRQDLNENEDENESEKEKENETHPSSATDSTIELADGPQKRSIEEKEQRYCMSLTMQVDLHRVQMETSGNVYDIEGAVFGYANTNKPVIKQSSEAVAKSNNNTHTFSDEHHQNSVENIDEIIESPDPIEETEDDSDRLCVVCLTELKDTVMSPCRHLCLCIDCAKLMLTMSADADNMMRPIDNSSNRKCPICRRVVKFVLHLKKSSSTGG